MSFKKDTPQADVCLILEGSYPYVAGGVSSWVHDLIQMQPHLHFHLLILLAPASKRAARYVLPENVIGTTEVTLQRFPKGRAKLARSPLIIQRIEPALNRLMHSGGLCDLATLLEVFSEYGDELGQRFLLESRSAWDMLLRMYRQDFSQSSFLDYFWTWRGLLGGLYSVLKGDLPSAKVYHAVSTGYAGLYLARAKLETGRAGILTEHGIYTNERRIEIAMADWLHEDAYLQTMSIIQTRRNIRDLWMHSFQSYSRACYEACDKIITLFEGNQNFQLHDGAPKERMEVVPNGIDYGQYASLTTNKGNPGFVVALIGRVVPIKDIKTYIRAIAQVKEVVPQVRAYVIGPFDEDPEYFQECQQLVVHLGISDELEFTGRVDLMAWLHRIDINVLTSISEGQPLALLEAGAASIPSVATDVGACREIIEGDKREQPAGEPGGMIVPLSNPASTARAIIRLLSDPLLLKRYGCAMQARVRLYYNKTDLQEKYRALYQACMDSPNDSSELSKVKA